MPGPHPTDRRLAALIDGRLDVATANDVNTHVLSCARCQLRVGSADPSSATEGAAPQSDVVAVGLLEEIREEIAFKGDVWRLSWDETVLLAVVWHVDSERVWVLPIVEIADADEWCALISGHGSAGLGDIAVAVAHETAVPWAVLDARVAQLPDLEPLTLLRAAYRTGASSEGLRRGESILSPLDSRLVESDELAEELSVLANAVWAPVATGAEAVELTYDLLESAGLPANRALAIGRRGAAPTDGEADRIEAATGVRPARPPVDDDLRKKIDSPFRKPKIRARAKAHRQSEAQERLALAREAAPDAIAARGTSGEPLDFDDVLDRLLGD